VVFRKLTGPAPESRLVVGWRSDPPPQPALAALLDAAAQHAAV
jgi:LysR family transcriptional regulator, benzoate and cis,cis-muconate-responsive activator of ben and cat genes